MMKLRQGFVSNSSSASFVVKKEGLTQAQLDLIWDYFGKSHGWHLTEGTIHLKGYTVMDNTEDGVEFFWKSGIPYGNVYWDGDNEGEIGGYNEG